MASPSAKLTVHYSFQDNTGSLDVTVGEDTTFDHVKVEVADLACYLGGLVVIDEFDLFEQPGGQGQKFAGDVRVLDALSVDPGLVVYVEPVMREVPASRGEQFLMRVVPVIRDFVSFPLQALWGAVLFRRQPKEGFWHLFRRIRRTDGVGGFWRGYTYKFYMGLASEALGDYMSQYCPPLATSIDANIVFSWVKHSLEGIVAPNYAWGVQVASQPAAPLSLPDALMELPSLDIWQWSLHQPFAYPVFGYLGALRGLYNLGTSIMEAREVHFVLDLQVASAPDFTTAFTNATNVVLADPVQPILQMCSLHLVNALWTAAISTFLRRSVGRMINLALLSRTDVNFKLFTMGCILSSIGVVAGLGVALALQYTAT